MSRFAALDDRLSPILVKEVRQALRGRTFAFAFVIALSLALLPASCVAIASVGERAASRADQVIMPIFAVLLGALLVYVPFHGLQSMRQEEAESERDLLALSPLGPWRIVLGKLIATLIVAGLILAAFAPFVVVMALHPGVNTVAVLMLLVHVAGVCTLLSALGISAGVARTNRVGKGIGAALLAFATLGAYAMETQATQVALGNLGNAKFAPLLGVGWLYGAACAPLLLGFAAAALARDDRETSPGLRRAWVLAVLASAVMTAFILPMSVHDAEAVVASAAFSILAGTFVASVIITEDERLDVESRARITAARGPLGRHVVGLLSVGGGRGVLLTLVLGVFLVVAALFGVTLTPSRANLGSVAFVLLVALGTSLAFAVIPGRIVVHARSRPSARRTARWASAISLVTLSLLMPLIVGIATQGGVNGDELYFSPLFVLMEASFDVGSGRDFGAEVVIWAVIGFFALCVAAPSALRGLRELSGLGSTARR